MGLTWNLRVIFICISLITEDIEHLFRCFLAIRFSSVRILCLALYPILFGLLVSNFLSSLYLLDISPLCELFTVCFDDMYPQLLQYPFPIPYLPRVVSLNNIKFKFVLSQHSWMCGISLECD